MEFFTIKMIASAAVGLISGYFLKKGMLEEKVYNTSNDTNDLIQSIKLELQNITSERGEVYKTLTGVSDRMTKLENETRLIVQKALKQEKKQDKELVKEQEKSAKQTPTTQL